MARDHIVRVIDSYQQELKYHNQPKQQLALGTLASDGVTGPPPIRGLLRISKARSPGSTRGHRVVVRGVFAVVLSDREELEVFQRPEHLAAAAPGSSIVVVVVEDVCGIASVLLALAEHLEHVGTQELFRGHEAPLEPIEGFVSPRRKVDSRYRHFEVPVTLQKQGNDLKEVVGMATHCSLVLFVMRETFD
jgi:hypothetical protein